METTASVTQEENGKKKVGLGVKLLGILALLIIVGGAIGYFFLWNSANTLTTDNAKVAAKFYAIMPMGGGKLPSSPSMSAAPSRQTRSSEKWTTSVFCALRSMAKSCRPTQRSISW